MDKKFVTPGVLTWKTDAIKFYGATLADFTYNDLQVLTSHDTSGFMNELVELQNVNDAAVTTTLSTITFEGPLVPASTTGISLTNGGTSIQITKRGHYQFKLQTNFSTPANTLFKLRMDGNDEGHNVDDGGGAAVEVGTDQNRSVIFISDFQQTTDTTHTFYFVVAAVSTSDPPVAVRYLPDLTIWHLNLSS
ncbi:MAG TPA: hypothetical protein VFP45_03360 [Candidatus Nitrosotalea sp.]|nr:hypothetical protein [Candidatus Nitrosotalea sp.]